MNCNEIELLISRKKDGDLSKSELRVLNNHLNSCKDCKELAEDFDKLSASLKFAFNTEKKSRYHFSLLKPYFITTFSVFVLLAGFFLFFTKTKPVKDISFQKAYENSVELEIYFDNLDIAGDYLDEPFGTFAYYAGSLNDEIFTNNRYDDYSEEYLFPNSI